jgi:carboxymethylenebutenolidase
MIEHAFDIHTADGTCDAILIRPDDERPRPGVLHLSDVFGHRPAHLDLSRRIAALGYVVLSPNVFYRTARPPLFDFVVTPGEDRAMKRFAELSSPLTPDAVERDASSYVDALAAEPSVAAGGMGIVGHCFSGGLALRIAAARPDRITAVASLHGGRLATDAPTSPHRVLPRVKARLYFAHATNDGSMPQDAINRLTHALEAWGGDYESEVYAGASHGWTMPDKPAYDPAQAERAFEKVKALFATSLAPPVGVATA